MRVLILSDTHGNLHLINKFAAKTGADVVLHCGDFSFYLEDRLELSPLRELGLRIRHSTLPREIRKKAFDYSREERLAIVKKHHLEGEFQLYVNGKEKFQVPLYVVYGNHEDQGVIRDLLNGTITVPNLHLVDESSDIVLGEGKGRIRIVGIGGNFIHYTFFNRAWSDDYYPSMRFVQWIKLLKRFPRGADPKARPKKQEGKKMARSERKQKAIGKEQSVAKGEKEEPQGTESQDDLPLWVMTHVSPGKLPSLELFSTYLRSPVLWFSGHMGPFIPQHYSMFTFVDDYEFAERTTQDVGFLLQLFNAMLPLWEFWYLLEVLSPFDEKEMDIAYILKRKELGKTPATPVYSSFEEFPPGLIQFLGLRDASEPPSAKEKEGDVQLHNDATGTPPVCNLPRGLREQIKGCGTPHELAEQLRFILYIEPHMSKADKQKLAKLLTKEELKEQQRNRIDMQFPFPASIPTLEDLQLMKDNIHYLHSIANRASRTPSDQVKKMPLYFNLSDAYQGGYMTIDIDSRTGVMDIQLRGTYPPPETVVDPADDPWLGEH